LIVINKGENFKHLQKTKQKQAFPDDLIFKTLGSGNKPLIITTPKMKPIKVKSWFTLIDLIELLTKLESYTLALPF
jgi:hypothetical protein